MNFFKRAITSITRRIGKTAILLALVFILGNVIAGAFSIGQSVKNTESAVLKGIVPMATLQENWQKTSEAINEKIEEEGIMPDWNDPNFDFESFDWDSYHRRYEEIRQEVLGDYILTAEKIEELGALPSVYFFDYTNMANLMSNVIRRFTPPEFLDDSRFGFHIPEEGERDWLTLTGNQTSDPIDLRVGAIELVDGRKLTDSEVNNGEYVVLISKQFADHNNLQAGSTFILNHIVEVWPEDDGGFPMARGGRVVVDSGMIDMPEPELVSTLEFEFKVAGIYEPNIPPSTTSDDQWNNNPWEEVERRNRIYTSNNAIRKINDLVYEENAHYFPGFDASRGKDQEFLMPFFAFEDNNGLEEFIAVAEGIFGDFYWIMDNELDFDNIVAPLRNMSGLANIILYVGIGASLIILSLLITLFLRDRRSEIGIYLALGERKGKVVGQILAEVMLVAILGVTLSLFSGNFVSAMLSNSMIDNQINAQQEKEINRRPAPPSYDYDQNPLTRMGYGADITLEDIADNYKVTLDANIIILFYAGGIITVLLSTLIPILYILRLNPRKILM
jgi:putative ABC transport system permease protein